MAALPGALRPGELLIDDDFKDNDALYRPVVDGEFKGRGHDPAQIDPAVESMFQPPSGIQKIDKAKWSDEIKELVRQQALLSDLRKTVADGGMMPCLDQGPVGYCWAHSTAHCVMLDRGLRNMPYVPLSAYSVAATIKRGADEGGWCGLSCKFMREKGIVSQALWPQGDRGFSKYQNNPAIWEDAAKHAIVEDWYDVAKREYDQEINFEAVCSLLMSGIPVVGDFNWWGHSVALLDVVEVEPGDFGIRILNSWGMGWGDAGTSVLRGSKARPDGAIAVRTTKVSLAS